MSVMKNHVTTRTVEEIREEEAKRQPILDIMNPEHGNKTHEELVAMAEKPAKKK